MRFNLKDFRNRLKLTQQAMADKISTSKQNYCSIEQGLTDPSFAILDRFYEEFEEAIIERQTDVYHLFKKEVATNANKEQSKIG